LNFAGAFSALVLGAVSSLSGLSTCGSRGALAVALRPVIVQTSLVAFPRIRH
jgi:hypothetical protein